MLDEYKELQQLETLIKDFNITLTEEELLNLLQIKYRWRHDTIEFINHAGMVSNLIYDIDEHLNFDKFVELYNLGFPSIIANIMDITAELRNLDKELFKVRGCNTNANLYFSKGTTSHRPSFDLHTHDYNVIAKSIYGKAKWKVGMSEFVLNPGETVIIPKGTQHAVLESTEPRLSLTLNMTG
jgi:mannose-6-phosphate isomerase-like protein (cupin superfamily)